MAPTSVLSEILEAFYAKLSSSGAVDEETLKELRALFASGEKLKAEDFVAVLSRGKDLPL